MPRMPRISASEAIRALQRDGWQATSSVGSHMQLIHPTKTGKVTVPMHRGTLKPGTLASIMKQAGLTVDQFRDLL